MSLNLELIIDRHGLPGRILAHTCLPLRWQDYDAFDLIKAEAVPLVDGVQRYEDDQGLTDWDTDPYEEPLTFLPAHTIARHLSKAPLRGWDAAVLAFLNALPPATRVVLWWN